MLGWANHFPYSKFLLWNGVPLPAQELLSVQLNHETPWFCTAVPVQEENKNLSFNGLSSPLTEEHKRDGSFPWISVEQRSTYPPLSMNCIPSRRRAYRVQSRWSSFKVWIFSNLNMLLTAHVLSFRNSSWILSAEQMMDSTLHSSPILLFSWQPKEVQNTHTFQWAYKLGSRWLIPGGTMTSSLD